MHEIKRIVAFAILMENNDGIIGKAPSYITEKFTMCEMMDHPEALLDMSNKAKFDAYCELWLKEVA